jgi:hypothetical protein
MQPNLSPEDYSTLAALLRATIAADRFPLSPRPVAEGTRPPSTIIRTQRKTAGVVVCSIKARVWL